MPVLALLFRRDDPSDVQHSPGYFKSVSTEAKFGVFGFIFVTAIVFFSLSYLHILHRRKKGLEPLKYHGWMVKKQRPPMLTPQPPRPTYLESRARPAAGQPEEYKMTKWAPPPPVYNADVPPDYNTGGKNSTTSLAQAGDVQSNDRPSSSASPGEEARPTQETQQLEPSAPAPAVLRPSEIIYR